MRTTGTIQGRQNCSTRTGFPPFHDPFAGGGTIPLEAQRLGLEAHASDLNPVAVLINKAMIEIPPSFAGRPPVNPEARRGRGSTEAQWKGAAGLAEDVRYYGKWMRDEAEKRIGHLYPKIEVTMEMAQERPDLKPYVGRKLTVIAWLWARTVKSPNPAFVDVDVPLASSFVLSTKSGKEAYIEPVIERGGYRFTVKAGLHRRSRPIMAPNTGGSGSIFLCLMSGVPMPFEYLRSEAKAGRMRARLMAIVAEGDRGRVYLEPTEEQELSSPKAQCRMDSPETDLPERALGFRVQEYGMTEVARPLHRPPTGGADHIFRPRGGSPRAHRTGRIGDWYARRRCAACLWMVAKAQRPTPRPWVCIWRLP